MDQQLYLVCMECGEVFDAEAPLIAIGHKNDVHDGEATFELVTENEAF